jgi:hypothetical protein
MLRKFAFSLVILSLVTVSFGQSSEKNIELQSPSMHTKAVMELLKDPANLKLTKNEVEFAALMAKPSGEKFDLTPPSTQKLTGRQVYAKAKAALLKVGWQYLCKNCNDWHFSLAGAYAISSDGLVATCHHCVEPPAEMKSGHVVVVHADGTLAPLKKFVYLNKTLDLAVFQVESNKLSPLGLAIDCLPGDAAYIYSNPLDVNGYFSVGIVNRYFWNDDIVGDLKSADGVATLRVNLSTDWAPGSSGAPILNDFGNVIGHVTTISPQAAGRQTMFWTHEAVPALGVKLAVGK